MFLLLDFCYVAFDGKLALNTWYIPIILFLKAILFGGIEEVGWRYIFQPIMMERHSYISSTLITFVLWGIWHFFLFLHLRNICHKYKCLDFLLGLLTNCFIFIRIIYKDKQFVDMCDDTFVNKCFLTISSRW